MVLLWVQDLEKGTKGVAPDAEAAVRATSLVHLVQQQHGELVLDWIRAWTTLPGIAPM